MVQALLPNWYKRSDVFERERVAVWSSEWVMFCPAAEVATTGAYVADEVAGFPVFVSRGPDGALRGFHNVCPHRAGVIVWPGEGVAANLVCRYHGWAFQPDGALRSARDFGDEVELCNSDTALRQIGVAEWHGMIFVNLSDQPVPFGDAIAPFASECLSFSLDSFVYARRMVRELDCNWKTYVDNYLEGYHVPLLHPSLNRTLKMSTYTVEVPDETYCIHRAETAAGSPSGGAWLFRYPNLALNIYADGMNVERIVPVGPGRTHVVYDYYAAPGKVSASDIDAMVAMSNEVLDEDQQIVEVVQRNLDAGVYRAGRLSPKHEGALVWFQRRLRAAVGEM